MSRRGAEFQHRTSIFEGAYRAWSHLGRLDPNELETKTTSDLDPTNYNSDNLPSKVDVETGRDYPYEPLPRSGLSHPFVKAILTPWLGPDVDDDGVKLGLDTLRTWWQHRRKGQNTSAIKALSSDKMRTAVDEYTRHFFQIAHCLVVSDKEQPPKGLQMRLKESGRRNVMRITDGIGESCPNWNSILASTTDQFNSPPIDMKGKCIPGHLNLSTLVDGINHKAIQISHRGVKGGIKTEQVQPKPTYGDPSSFPVVYQGENGERHIVLVVNGMICAHCIKIVETVLKGCSGQRSPIDGLLDAAADQECNGVLIKIDKTINARRIAHEAARNLSLVGYKADAIDIRLDGSIDDAEQRSIKLHQVIKAYEHFGSTSPILFDWTLPCTCPDSGVYRNNCRRHAQMLPTLLVTFKTRKDLVIEYLSGSTKQVPINPPLGGVDVIFDSTSGDVFDDEEEPIFVEQDMNLSFYHDIDSEPIPLDFYTNDVSYLQQPLAVQQNFFSAPQPVGYCVGPLHSTISQGSRGNANFIPAQQVSALDSEYFPVHGVGWSDQTPVEIENDPELEQWGH